MAYSLVIQYNAQKFNAADNTPKMATLSGLGLNKQAESHSYNQTSSYNFYQIITMTYRATIDPIRALHRRTGQ